MTADPPGGHRRRTYVFPGRQKRLSIRVTDDEYAEIATAANQLGLTATSFCANTALDTARSLHTGTAERMEREALGNLQAELFQARITLNQIRAELARSTTPTTTPRPTWTRSSLAGPAQSPDSTASSPASTASSPNGDPIITCPSGAHRTAECTRART